MKINRFDKRIELIKKFEKNKKYHPSKKELEESYSYLDSCYNCGKRFSLWDRFSFNISHGTLGNFHRRDC